MIILVKILVLVLSAAFFFTGCAGKDGQRIPDGREYGSGSFQGHWLDYYERGRSFSDGKYYREAIADFQKAVEGRSQDQWNTDENGGGFADYFPHRESGIVHFRRGQYDLAIHELQLSIQSAPSARAHFYLNKAREKKLRGEERDLRPPELHFEGTAGRRTTNSFTHVVKGVAADDTFVASVRVGDRSIPIALAEKQVVFTIEIPLNEGMNIFPVTAVDLAGKTIRQDIEIFCDRQGPLVEIIQVEHGEDGKGFARGVVSDASGLGSLTINGDPWKISGHYPAYNFKFALDGGGTVLIATDKVGNVTKAVIKEEEAEADPLLTPGREKPHAISMFNLAPLVIAEQNDPLPAAGISPPADSDPPFITIEGLGPGQETYDEYILLKGLIADRSPIQSVSINGEPLNAKNGRKLYFSKLKKLAEGGNTFLVTAIDTQGNIGERTITVDKKIRNIHRIDSRMSIAVLPFARKGAQSLPDGRVHDQLTAAFREQQRFNIAVQDRIEAMLRETMLNSIDLADPRQAAETGKTLAVNAVLTGTVIESAGGIEIIARLVDTETAAILAINNVYGEDLNDSALTELFAGLALLFKEDLPILEGIVTKVTADGALINIGSDRQVKPVMRFICYRKGLGMKHPVTGRLMGAEPEILGELTVTEVNRDFSKASLLKKKGNVQAYDRVIAR